MSDLIALALLITSVVHLTRRIMHCPSVQWIMLDIGEWLIATTRRIYR